VQLRRVRERWQDDRAIMHGRARVNDRNNSETDTRTAHTEVRGH
jgi:hypothetical protein